MTDKKVVVVGATGTLGLQIVKELMARGAEVTAMVRLTSNRKKLESLGVKDFVIADMMDYSSLREALLFKNFDAIVASAAGYTKHTKGDNPKTDTLGYQNLVEATKEAGISRFVLISILESDKAVTVPHFHNKYLTEQYLRKKQQPFIALRAGAFFDWSREKINQQLRKGILPVFFTGVDYGTIYTSDLARYAAMAAISLPDTALNTAIDVGWRTPVNDQSLAAAFSKVLKKPVKAKPVLPGFVIKIVAPILAKFNENMADMLEMIRWVNTGAYVSKDIQTQEALFGDLPSVEEAAARYAQENGLIS